MTSRDIILNKLRAARDHIPAYQPLTDHLPMIPLDEETHDLLVPRFIEQAQRLGAIVHAAEAEQDAIQMLLTLIDNDQHILCWPFEHIQLVGLDDALRQRGIQIAAPRDASVRVGITGVDAALAATGSIVLTAAPGKHRATSLLPPVHIAVVRASQIVPTLEQWVAMQRQTGIAAFRALSSVIVISGPSRTADIAMQLTLGMHGPAELHLIVLTS